MKTKNVIVLTIANWIWLLNQLGAIPGWQPVVQMLFKQTADCTDTVQVCEDGYHQWLKALAEHNAK